MTCYQRELGKELDIVYEGEGSKLAVGFYIPVLRRTKAYYRVSGFFSVDSLTVIATGLAGLIKNEGKMRLIVGLHDVNPEIIEAYRLSREKAAEILEEFGRKVAQDLDKVADEIARRRIEALAWMLANGTLEVKVALPRKTFLGLGNGIFHEKLMIFTDTDGCIIAAVGSANETRYAYEVNGENLTVHMSWREGHLEYIRRYFDRFNSLWDDKHPDYIIFPLPEVVRRKLWEKFYPKSMPASDPLESQTMEHVDHNGCILLTPAARLIQHLGETKYFAHLGIGPVILYPHQAYAVDYVLSRFPHRAILADEVGLGKTIEAGAIIRRLISSGKVERVLILAPKNLTRQWLDEMWERFGLRFWLYDNIKRAFVSADGDLRPVSNDENPFDIGGIDLIVASWHYVRGSKKRDPEILNSRKFFDLLVIDEAHHARRKRYIASQEIETTKLYELVSELSVTSPNILLLTATPVQLYASEALDLLGLLGVRGPWVHDELLETYFKVLISNPSEISDQDIRKSLSMIVWFAQNFLNQKDVERILANILGERETNLNYLRKVLDFDFLRKNFDLETVKRILYAFNPLQWFMVRNTREKLASIGFSFPERDIKEIPVELSSEHKEILDMLDRYLREEYGRYEKVMRERSRVVVGLVKSVYHQRFVSSFTAAYLTVKNRREFLEALLQRDREALLKTAAKMLEDVEFEGDEDEVIESMEELLREKGREPILRELNVLKELEWRLSGYSPDSLSLTDPKLRKVANTVKELVDSGNKVLVFSKYTDTVEAIVRFLIKGGYFLKSEIGIYTGEGGKIYDDGEKDFVSIRKDVLVEKLSEGTIKVLVCSDAASEGLNLQAASAVVNVDMPWNPAKVEQRIGRVDRLGQKEKVVLVRNIWYPDSVEAQMYKALFQRKEIYRLVVGPAQDIISEGLRKALDVGGTYESINRVVEETLAEVERLKNEIARITGIYSGVSWSGKGYEYHEVVRRLIEFIFKACKALKIGVKMEDGKLVLDDDKLPSELKRWNKININVGVNNALTPSHPIVKWLCERITANADSSMVKFPKSIYLVLDEGGLWSVRIISDESSAQEELDAEGVLRLLDELLGVTE